MLRVLAVIARLVAPPTGDVTIGDVEAAAIHAAEWFVELRLLSRAEASRGLDADLRACGTDNRCITEALDRHAIDLGAYVVVNLETGFATAELLGRSSPTPLATEAIELGNNVEAAVTKAVTRVLAAAGHERGARLVVDAKPPDAITHVGSTHVASGEAIYVAAGKQTIEARAPGFEVERRELELAEGDTVALHLELQPTASPLESWWLWGGVAVVAAAAVIIPVIALGSSNEPAIVCYGTSRQLCEPDR